MKTRRPILAAAVLATAIAAAACSSGGGKGTPVNFSEPVGITLTAHKQDVDAGGVLLVQKNINTESGNPFGKFVNDATAKLGGNPPSSVALSSLIFSLSSSSSIAGLEDLFAGPASIAFVLNGSTADTPVGTATNPAGVAVSMTQSFDTAVMTSADYASFLAGQFKVSLTGTANPSFSTGNPNADMKATFTFEAFQ